MNSSNCVAWFKDGELISSEDLSNGTTLMSPSRGTVSSSYMRQSSNLTIVNSTITDSGNYTCVLSCVERNTQYDAINSSSRDTIEVLVFGECHVVIFSNVVFDSMFLAV